MANEKTCFIIMPVTTPAAHLERYGDGPEHFRHVLECLLAPAAEEAGFDVVRPTAKGADVIHAEIIKNLESADMVLCDMSCLNPNVFFEFGIRTALNKPVCVVRDELTDRVPFDTVVLNHHTYRSGLESWELHDQIEALAEHLKQAALRSAGSNPLWKNFALRAEARPLTGTAAEADLLGYLMLQMESLQQSITDLRLAVGQTEQATVTPLMLQSQLEAAVRYAGIKTQVQVEAFGARSVVAHFQPPLSEAELAKVRDVMLHKFDRHVYAVDE